MGLETLGVIDENGFFVDLVYNLRPNLTDKSNKFYTQKTSIRNTFTKQTLTNLLFEDDGKTSVRNLSLSFDLFLK